MRRQLKKTQPCPACGGTMTFGVKSDRLSYKGHTRTIRSRGWWCGACGEGILDGRALKASERAFQELKAEAHASHGDSSTASTTGTPSDASRSRSQASR
jgi:YgiT-type zinc finger domain-containing protein